jgi:hypothetical protein
MLQQYSQSPQPAFSQHALPQHMQKQPSHQAPSKQAEPDILRNSALRYWGYINEIAESLKDLMNAGFKPHTTEKIVKGSYGVVDKYVWIDSFDKAVKGFKQAEEDGYGRGAQLFSAAEKGADAYLFQCGASLYGPAFIISIFRDYAKMALFHLLGDKQGAKHLAEEVSHTVLNTAKEKSWLELQPERLKQWLFKKTPFEKLPSTLGKSLSPKVKSIIAKGLPMVTSLALIPVLVHPIDKTVNFILDITYRPILRGIKHAIFGKPPAPKKPHQNSHHPIAPLKPVVHYYKPAQQPYFSQPYSYPATHNTRLYNY